jgi:MSHA biogenesis protein MshO
MDKKHPTNLAKPFRSLRPGRFHATGFTLIELIMVIVITGIISGMVAVFIKTPVRQYLDVARRAEMTDIADTALRRMARDIRTAVPNSVRPQGTNTYIEFLPTKAGGRYRADAFGGSGACGAAGDELSFASADTCFEMTGAAMTFAVGDYIVIGSTQSDAAPPYDQTVTGVLRAVAAGAAQTKVTLLAPNLQFPAFANLEGQRFQVISGTEQAVTYACENVGGTTEGTGTLKRYWHYGFNSAQVAPPTGGLSALLSDKISDCSIVYSLPNQRNGLVAISLTLTRGGENVRLYHEIHVNNLP